SMAWSPDSKTIYFTAENEGMAPIYAINVTAPNPWPHELVAGFNDSPTPTPDGKTLVFDRMSVAAPNEIYSAPLLFPQCRWRHRQTLTAFPIACSRRRSR